MSILENVARNVKKNKELYIRTESLYIKITKQVKNLDQEIQIYYWVVLCSSIFALLCLSLGDVL